jgi:hypothetical protein
MRGIDYSVTFAVSGELPSAYVTRQLPGSVVVIGECADVVGTPTNARHVEGGLAQWLCFAK